MIRWPELPSQTPITKTIPQNSDTDQATQALQKMAKEVGIKRRNGSLWRGRQLLAFAEVSDKSVWVHIPPHMRKHIRTPWRESNV